MLQSLQIYEFLRRLSIFGKYDPQSESFARSPCRIQEVFAKRVVLETSSTLQGDSVCSRQVYLAALHIIAPVSLVCPFKISSTNSSSTLSSSLRSLSPLLLLLLSIDTLIMVLLSLLLLLLVLLVG